MKEMTKAMTAPVVFLDKADLREFKMLLKKDIFLIKDKNDIFSQKSFCENL